MALALQLTLLLQRMLLTESVVSRRSWTRRTHGIASIALGMWWHASSTFKCPVHDCNIFHCKLLRRPPGLACLPSSPSPLPTPSVLWQENLSWSRGQNASRNSIGPVRGTWNVFAMGMATLRTTSSRMRWLTLASDVRNQIAS